MTITSDMFLNPREWSFYVSTLFMHKIIKNVQTFMNLTFLKNNYEFDLFKKCLNTYEFDFFFKSIYALYVNL